MSKYIFLDIDGVLNSEEMLNHKPFPKCRGMMGIEKSKVKRLKQIVEATGAEIVLTSSWKKSFDAFKRNGYRVVKIEESELANFWVEELENAEVKNKIHNKDKFCLNLTTVTPPIPGKDF